MKKLVLISLLVLFPLVISGCGKAIDPVTDEEAFDTLRKIFDQVISEGPKDPWDPKDEFETTSEYQRRLSKQQEEYYSEAGEYYGGVERQTFVLIHEIEELPEFNADIGSYEIPYMISTCVSGILGKNAGPDFQLLIPPDVQENIHLFDDNLFTGDEWYQGKNCGIAVLTFFASLRMEDARKISEAAASMAVFLRVGIQFDFPDVFQGYRFLSERYVPFEEEDSMFESPFVTELKQEDLNYGQNEGKVTVIVAWVEIVDEEGNAYHIWPRGLVPAQTPTFAPTQTKTPFPTSVLPVEPTKTRVSTSTEVVEETKEPVCLGAMEMRMKVGITGRVTNGDPRSLRLREEPTISAKVITYLKLGKEFLVIGGPVCADGFLWWQIEVDSYSGYWVAEGEWGNYFIEPEPLE